MADAWQHERLFFDGDEYFTDVFAAIAAARQSIALEVYILADDKIGTQCASLLTHAAERGVATRLLVDGVGSYWWVRGNAPTLARTGVAVRVFHPLTAIGMALARGLLRPRKTWAARLNRRIHRKTCIVDGVTAWVGSVNMTEVHSRAAVGREAWRDTAVRIEGAEGVDALSDAFENAWRKSSAVAASTSGANNMFFLPARFRRRPPSTRSDSPLVYLNYRFRMRRRNYLELVRRMEAATDVIWITTAYLAPTSRQIWHLARAAQRGVDVRILVPSQSDVALMLWVAKFFYHGLIGAKARVFEYGPPFLHAKTVIIDDWAIVGTSNMNRRSLHRDLEADIALSHESSRAELREQFLRDLKLAREVGTPPRSLAALVGWLVSSLLGRWI